MNKIKIDINNPPENLKLLAQFVIAEARSAGGDGDCTIICRCYEMKDVADLIWKELEIMEHQKWYEYVVRDDKDISIVAGEEAIMITNDVNYVGPEWLQCVIKI